MEYANLKQKSVKYIRYERDSIEMFSKLKKFCGEQCSISYDMSSIEYFWKVTVNDSFHNDEKKIVGKNNFIIEYDDNKFCVMDNSEFDKWFEILEMY